MDRLDADHRRSRLQNRRRHRRRAPAARHRQPQPGPRLSTGTPPSSASPERRSPISSGPPSPASPSTAAEAAARGPQCRQSDRHLDHRLHDEARRKSTSSPTASTRSSPRNAPPGSPRLRSARRRPHRPLGRPHPSSRPASGDHTLYVKQQGNQLVGTHQGEFTARDCSGTISGDDVRIASSIGEVHGAALSYRFTGKLDGDTISGDVDLGEYLGAKFTATRHAFGTRAVP